MPPTPFVIASRFRPHGCRAPAIASPRWVASVIDKIATKAKCYRVILIHHMKKNGPPQGPVAGR